MVQRVSTVAFEGIEVRPVDVQVRVAPGLAPGEGKQDARDDAQEDDHGPNVKDETAELLIGHAADSSSAGRIGR
jgi:hypothetical protein